jgi:hypothetical protein
MVDKKSLDFLPKVFQTNTNRRFLNVTMDQLLQEPNLGRMYGYIGRQDLSPAYQNGDAYVQEIDSYSQFYQLEPGLVINKRVFNTNNFKTENAYNYVDLLNAITSAGGITDNHSRLFSNEYYNYEGFVDLDKLINYGKYYWVPNGPTTLEVNSGGLPLKETFTISRPISTDNTSTLTNQNIGNFGYSIDKLAGHVNPDITLVRGGNYTFNLGQPGHPFYIQTEPGIEAGTSYQANISRRDVYGVVNNGVEQGTMVFKVPKKNAQAFYENMEIVDEVDLVTDIPYSAIQGADYTEFTSKYRIDGNTSFETKRIILTNDQDDQWQDVPQVQKRGIWQIDNIEGTIRLSYISDWAVGTKIFVKEGFSYGHIYVFKDSRLNIRKVPQITDNLDTLYYQDGVDANVFGIIRIVDQGPTPELKISNIVNQINYTSPNGVKFTNGLKIKFTGNIIPETFVDNEYIVEGVGTGIRLVPYADLVTPDPNNPNLGTGFSSDYEPYDTIKYDLSLNAPLRKDYIVINRASVDGNAWSRTNRWFHEDVIRYAATFENSDAPVVLNNSYRANRPIVEFDANLRLWDHGYKFAHVVTAIDSYATDIANQIEGRSPDILVSGANLYKNITANAGIGSSVLTFDTVTDLTVGTSVSGPNIADGTEITEINISSGTITLSNPLLLDLYVGNTISFGTWPFISDGVKLEDGTLVIFTNEKYTNTREKVYQIKNITPHSGSNINKITTLFSAVGKNYLTFSTVSDLLINMKVTGSNIPANTVITSIDPLLKRVTISNHLTHNVPKNSAITFNPINRQVHLVPVHTMSEGETVVAVSGIYRQNKTYWWHNNTWQVAQQKFSLNQSPLFDIFDISGNSRGDKDYYPSSSFAGSKLFGYKEAASGTRDSELGIVLSYKSIGNIGDILFQNFYDTDTFTYSYNNADATLSVNSGFAHEYIPLTDGIRFRNNWVKIADESKQYIQKKFNITQYKTNNFPIDVVYVNGFNEKNIFVYVNGKELLRTRDFTLLGNTSSSLIQLTNDLVAGDTLVINIFGTTINNKENYTIPKNLVDNSENDTFETLTLGQIRNHLLEITKNSLNYSSNIYGNDNLRDINFKIVPGKILQHSAGVHTTQLLFNNDSTNIAKSIDFNRRSYSRFKDKFLYLLSSTEFSNYDNARECLDTIMEEITANASQDQAFYFTDMMPYGINNFVLNEYSVYDTNYRNFNLINTYDVNSPNYQSVLVYLNGTQLLVGDDYISNGSVITLKSTLSLSINDVVSIYEYPNTQGCMIPATPTKLGLYPKFVPEKFLDTSYINSSVYVIQGHDGSKTVAFNDFRDNVLLEFERRIYNNINVEFTNNIKTSFSRLEPGAFRKTDYSLDEWTQLLSISFLNWAGNNNVNVFLNSTTTSDPLTYNYGQSVDRLFGEAMPGSWRAIFKYFYDTDAPNSHPWEMIGLSRRPDWWVPRYGPAPYTSGNLVLWKDMQNGLVYQHGYDSYVDTRYVRPGLLGIIPVDEHGELLSPLEVVISNFNSQTAASDWRFGDQSPQETAWRRSSEYPFAVQLAWALARPAEYCNISLNRRDIVRLDPLDQIINKTTGNRKLSLQISDSTQYVPGTNVWIRDRLADIGLDISTNFTEIFENYKLNLVYKTSGFTDKSYLQIIADQSSPNSTNSGVIIPQENYQIITTKSAPVALATYSAVVVQKTPIGFKVYGFDNARPYFTILPRSYTNNVYKIKVSNSSANIYVDNANNIQVIPYGTQMNTVQQVIDFLVSYGKFLTSSGFQFQDTDINSGNTNNWDTACKEFLFWLEQAWDVNTIISLSPAGSKIAFNSAFGIVDELTNDFNGSRIIDSDGNTLKNKDYVTFRTGTSFEMSMRDQTKGVHLIDMNVVLYEHTLIFDNATVFNDIIYEPSLGNRQYRMKISGFKTREWDGSLYAPGFLINHRSVDQWLPITDYYKGDVVLFKNLYYTARQFIPGATSFVYNNWYQIDGSLLSKQLIPNMAFNAQQFEEFYNVDKFDVNRSADTSSRNSTGFVPRQYMTDMGLDNISQHKFYLGMIREKGTQAAVNAFLRTKLPYLDNSVEIDEQWAVRLGSYGGVAHKTDIELSLANTTTLNGAYVVELIDHDGETSSLWNTFKPKDLLIKPVNYNKDIFTGTENNPKVIGTTGPVMIDDVDTTVFDMLKIQNISKLVPILKEGSRIWAASDTSNDWNVFRISGIVKAGNLPVNLRQVDDKVLSGINQMLFITDVAHGLVENDFIMIQNGGIPGKTASVTGFYRVSRLPSGITGIDPTKALVVPIYSGTTTATYTWANDLSTKPLVFKLNSVRFPNKSNFALNTPNKGWKQGDMVWVDGANGEYQVLTNDPQWTLTSSLTPIWTKSIDNFGMATDIKNSQDIMAVGAPYYNNNNGSAYVYNHLDDDTWAIIANLSPDDYYASKFGQSIKFNNLDKIVVGAPGSIGGAGLAYIGTVNSNNLSIDQVIYVNSISSSANFGTSVAASKDGNWIAVGAPGTNTVYYYKYKEVTTSVKNYDQAQLATSFGVPSSAQNIGLGPLDLSVRMNDTLLVPYLHYTYGGGQTISLNVSTWNTLTSYTKGQLVTHVDGSTTNLYQVINDHTSTSYFLDNGSWGNLSKIGNFQTIPVKITYQSYYRYAGSFTNTEVAGQFGYSMSFSEDGSQLVIGAPALTNTINNVSYTNMGAAYIFNRTIETFIANGTAKTFALENTSNLQDVYLDGVATTSYTIVGGTSLVLTTAPSAGTIVTIETNQFRLLEKKIGSTPAAAGQSNLYFGKSVLLCPTTCSLYVGATGYNHTSIANGAVYRFVNSARLYGSVNGLTYSPVLNIGDSIRLNGVKVTFTGVTAARAAYDINSANIPGISAVAVNNQYVQISSDSSIAYNKLVITPTSSQALLYLGINVFDLYQIITSNSETDTANFGINLYLNSTGTNLLVGANTAAGINKITFDKALSSNNTSFETTFDKTFTSFVTKYYQSGSAYLYEYQSEENETATFHGNFTIAQQLTPVTLRTDDRFSTGIALSDNWAMVTALNSSAGAGTIYTYNNYNGTKNWQTTRRKIADIDTRKIERMYLYNNNTKSLIIDLDILDPEHGIPVAAAAEQIKYIVNYDPAIYNHTPNTYSFSNDNRKAWGKEHVGDLWWDTNALKYLDWNQGQINNRLNLWGLTFPNSYINVYEWIESDVIPSQYAITHVTDGPTYTVSDVYTSKTIIDPLTLRSSTKYYFWVRNNNSNITQQRRETALSIQNLIANPRNTNDPFAAIINTNAIALFNCEHIVNNDTRLHISLTDSREANPIHQEWSMFDDGTDLGVAIEFLDRINDSLAGQDAQGRIVPDVSLTTKERYGLGIRPRQTTFVDPMAGRKVWVDNVNDILKKYPITLLRDITILNETDPVPVVDGTIILFSVTDNISLSYYNVFFYKLGDCVVIENDTTGGWSVRQLVTDPLDITNRVWQIIRVQKYNLSNFWTYSDWYATSYNSSTVIDKIVDYDYEITNGNVNVGDVVKIKYGSNGNWQLLLVKSNSLELIGQQNSTIQFTNNLYNNLAAGVGVDTLSFETIYGYSWDSAIEFRKIFDAVTNNILTNELRKDFKKVIKALLDNISTQFVQNDWLLKTSLINIKHHIRSLDEIPVYVKQPEGIVTSFINEVKPYHTQIKQYLSTYDKTDLAALDAVDFDLPPYYNNNLEIYRSPQLGNPIDTTAISKNIYSSWQNGHAYGIERIDVYNGGTGYSYDGSIKVQILGDGTGAKATAYVRNKQVVEIEVNNSGSGYTYAIVKIIDSKGTGATAFAKLGHSNARNFATTIKFDRFTYAPITQDWQANTSYGIGDLIIHNNEVYRTNIAHGGNGLTGTIPPGSTFLPDNFIPLVVRIWEPNKSYAKDTIIVYEKVPYVALTDFVSGRYFTYNSDISVTNSLEWNPQTYYVVNTIISNNGTAYKVTASFTSGVIFTNDNLQVVYSIAKYPGGYFDDAASRVWGYYNPLAGMPGRDLTQVMTGLEYGGIKIIGPDFNQIPGFGFGLYEQIPYDKRTFDENGLEDIYGKQQLDTVLYGLYKDTQLGIRSEDMITDGAGFVDVYNSYAPEEFVPGYMFDSLNVRVKALPKYDTYTSPNIVVIAAYGDDATTYFSFNPLVTNVPLPVGGVEFVNVYNDFDGPRILNVDYTIDWENQYVIFKNPPRIPSTIFISLIGTSGQNNVYDFEFVGDGFTNKFEVSGVKLSIIDNNGIITGNVQQAYIKVNGTKVTNWNFDRSPVVYGDVIWTPGTTFHQGDILRYVSKPLDWKPNTGFSAGSILVHDNRYFLVLTDFNTGSRFTSSNLKEYFGAMYKVVNDFVSGQTFDPFSPNVIAADRVFINFDVAPNINDVIQIHLFDTPITTKSYSEVLSVDYEVQDSDVGNSLGCVIALPEPIEYNRPWESSVAVQVNGVYLEPSNQAYYVGNSSTVKFSLPNKRNILDVTLIQDNDIVVLIDNVLQTNNIDYAINRDGINVPTITFNSPPVYNSKIVISDRSQAEYVVHNQNNVIIKPSYELLSGDAVNVLMYSNHDNYDFYTEVLSGQVTYTTSTYVGFDEIGFDLQGYEIEKTNIVTPIYTLSRSITNMNNVRVMLNGVQLTPYYDFAFSTPVTIKIDPAYNIGTDDIIVISHINETQRQLPIEFRIFKGVTETYEYQKISQNTTTILTRDLLLLDNWIYVRNVNLLTQPDPTHAHPGVIFVNGERITYSVIDVVNNRLGNIRRSTNGTGGAEIHKVNSYVYDGGSNVEIPNTRESYIPVAEDTILISKKGDNVMVPSGSLIRQGKLWYDVGDSSATNGLGLENSTSIQVNFLKTL